MVVFIASALAGWSGCGVGIQVLEERLRRSNGWDLVEQASCTVSIAGLQVRRKKYSSLNASPTDCWRRFGEMRRCRYTCITSPSLIRQSNLPVARSAAPALGPP